MKELLLLGLLSLIFQGVQAGELYKWTDAQGKVHFSDKPPKPSVGTAQTVEVKVTPVSEAQRLEANARLAKLKASVGQGTVMGGIGPDAMIPPDARQGGAMGGSACERAWREYNESVACFSANRGAGNRITAEGFEKCKAVAEPAPCR
jgi:Domain of unknown function (DUF4124)